MVIYSFKRLRALLWLFVGSAFFYAAPCEANFETVRDIQGRISRMTLPDDRKVTYIYEPGQPPKKQVEGFSLARLNGIYGPDDPRFFWAVYEETHQFVSNIPTLREAIFKVYGEEATWSSVVKNLAFLVHAAMQYRFSQAGTPNPKQEATNYYVNQTGYDYDQLMEPEDLPSVKKAIEDLIYALEWIMIEIIEKTAYFWSPAIDRNDLYFHEVRRAVDRAESCAGIFGEELKKIFDGKRIRRVQDPTLPPFPATPAIDQSVIAIPDPWLDLYGTDWDRLHRFEDFSVNRDTRQLMLGDPQADFKEVFSGFSGEDYNIYIMLHESVHVLHYDFGRTLRRFDLQQEYTSPEPADRSRYINYFMMLVLDILPAARPVRVLQMDKDRLKSFLRQLYPSYPIGTDPGSLQQKLENAASWTAFDAMAPCPTAATR